MWIKSLYIVNVEKEPIDF